MNKTVFTLILLATGAFFVILSQGKQLHLLIFASFLIATAITSFILISNKAPQAPGHPPTRR